MRLKFYLFALFLIVVGALSGLKANNITLSNISLTGQNTTDDYIMVQFDLSWENSWRTSSAPINWDAVWIFIKFRTLPNGEWQHAKLNLNGHAAPEGSVLQVGLVDESSAFNNSTNPVVGAFIYRSLDGVGTFMANGVQLRWNYGTNGVDDNTLVDVQLFALEMVYVSPGSFHLGSGGTETSAFYRYPTTTNTYQVLSEDAITVGTSTNNLYYGSSTYGGDRSGPIPTSYPKGFAGFYCMKYEISQQQYVDFLNNLPPSSASARFANSNTLRNGITVSNDIYSTTNAFLGNNYISWADGAAYADWAGLRPMSEMEYEKAARGPGSATAGQYAWGSTSVTQTTSIQNPGLENEIAGNTGALAVYGNHSNVQGPMRVGAFATNTSTRAQSGSGYWGIMELSGNLWEWVVSVGNTTGRGFTPMHGDGVLTSGGNGNTTSWPGLSAGEITGTSGSGVRGGGWTSNTGSLRISDREYANEAPTGRGQHRGFRAVRSVPVQDFRCGSSLVKDIDNNYYKTVQVGNQCWMNENLKTTRDRGENTVGRRCYDDNASNCNIYGGLYELPSSSVCPTGWHIPTSNEWASLEETLGGSSISGGKLKSTRTSPTAHPRWDSPNTGATNEVGFNALPGGYFSYSSWWRWSRCGGGGSSSSTYSEIGLKGYWWTSTGQFYFGSGYSVYSSNIRTMSSDSEVSTNSNSSVSASYSYSCGGDNSYSSYSIRCIKD